MKPQINALELLLGLLLISPIKGNSNSKNNSKGYPSLRWSNGGCPKRARSCPSSFQDQPPPLLLISIDSFRTTYLKRGHTPTLKKLFKCGVRARFMQPSFPTNTYPNHFSIVTGLYPSSHGIIDNDMSDPQSDKKFIVEDGRSHTSFWWEAQPIWVSAEQQGKKTGVIFWIGSEAEINGTLPTYTMEDENKDTIFSNISFGARIDKILKWLDLPACDRPSFMALHLIQPDHNSHHFGQATKKMDKGLAKVDRAITRLFSGLQKRHLIDCINVIFISDHGMTDIAYGRNIVLSKYLNISAIQGYEGTLGRFEIVKGANTSLEAIENALICRDPNMKVYHKEQLPVRLHYSSHRRIEPLVLYMDAGWIVMRNSSKKIFVDYKSKHGYDNFFPEMRAFFMALGPSMKKKTKVKPFSNIELYELMCELIGIDPLPNNGTRGSLHHLLKSPFQPLNNQTKFKPPPTAKKRVRPTHKSRNDSSTCSLKFDHEVNVNESKALHLPFGIPHNTDKNERHFLMYNKDYVLAYCSKLKIATWVSFTLPIKTSFLSEEGICWTADPRISKKANSKSKYYKSNFCKENRIFQRPLYPPVFSGPTENEVATLFTNSIPKSGYHMAIEERVTIFLREWPAKNGPTNVLTGPAFDFQATGVKPKFDVLKENKKGHLLIPTHIFLVLTWCSKKVDDLKMCNSTRLRSKSFILPNWPFSRNCEPTDNTIRFNMARIVDVEKLTGLSLYRDLPVYDAVRLRTAIAY